jgi:methionyl-tRNA formyltransferase
MPGRFSAPPLSALFAAGVEVVGVAVPAPPGAPDLTRLPATPAPTGLLPLAGAALPNILQLAAAHGTPAMALGRPLGPRALATMVALRPDLICVACWPWRLPPALLALPRHGCLNVHPSLLPDLRGPEPLFWTLQSGAERGGVTIHQMDENLDTGEIVLQAEVDLPAGIGWDEAEVRAAALGARLLAQAQGLLAAGNLPRRPQEPGGSYRPAPTDADFALCPDWPARRAFAFMRGTSAWGRPYPISLGGEEMLLAAAISYDPTGAIDQPYLRSGDLIKIQHATGTLTATLATGE